MAWKIIFLYSDGSQLKVSSPKKTLPKDLAEHYRKEYAKPGNDGGMVYISPFKNCEPVPLQDYINRKEI